MGRNLAHSHGTIVAQHYARLLGPTKVKKLVLSAPVSRHLDVELHHTVRIRSNLENIYKHYTSNPNCKWNGLRSMLENLSARLTNLFLADSKEFRDRTNDFCFLTQRQIDDINENLQKQWRA
jgi:hypothetical protein